MTDIDRFPDFPDNPPNPNDATPYFELFKAECMYWRKDLALTGWEMLFKLGDIGKNCAQVVSSRADMQATITLSKDWTGYDHDLNEQEIASTAFHELCELLLVGLEDLSSSRVDDSDIAHEKHTIIHVLDELIFQPYWQRRTQPAIGEGEYRLEA